MKQILSLLIAAMFIHYGVKAQQVVAKHHKVSHKNSPRAKRTVALIRVDTANGHIPDAYFAKVLHEKYPDCIDEKDNLLPAASLLSKLQINTARITTLDGIKRFTSLKFLDVGSNYLSALPELPTGLTYLDCAYNRLTSVSEFPAEKKFCIFQFKLSLYDEMHQMPK